MDDARRAILDSFHISACSYVKPGAMHRLNLTESLDRYILSSHALLPVVGKAYERGEEIARGSRGMPEAGLGSLILSAARTAYAWMGRPLPRLSAAAGAVVMAVSMGHAYASAKHLSAGSIRSSASRLVQSSTPLDFADFHEALRITGEHKAIDILEEKGLRPGKARVEGISLLDAFEALAPEYPAYSVLNPRSRMFSDTADLIRTRYEEGGNLNDAVVYAYVRIAGEKMPRDLRGKLLEAEENGLMKTRRGGRMLLEIDRELARRGVSLDKYVPVLTIVLAALIAEGLRP